MEITYIEEDGVVKEVTKQVIVREDKLSDLTNRLINKEKDKLEIEAQIKEIQNQIDSINNM